MDLFRRRELSTFSVSQSEFAGKHRLFEDASDEAILKSKRRTTHILQRGELTVSRRQAPEKHATLQEIFRPLTMVEDDQAEKGLESKSYDEGASVPNLFPGTQREQRSKLERFEAFFEEHLLLKPDNPYRLAWDVALLLVLLYTLIVVPMDIAFEFDSTASFVLANITWAVFIIDIGVTFCSAVEDAHSTELITSARKIAGYYGKSWLIVDLVSVIPFHIIAQDSNVRSTMYLKLPRMLRLLQITKLFRASRFALYGRYISENPETNPRMIRLAKLIFTAVVSMHILACVWYIIGTTTLRTTYASPDPPNSSWRYRVLQETKEQSFYSNPFKYLISVYWTISTLTTVGYGDISASTSGEIVFSVLVMFFGSIIFSYNTAIFSSSIAMGDKNNTLIRNKVAALRSFLAKHRRKLPSNLRNRIFKTMKHVWQGTQTKEAIYRVTSRNRESKVLQEIPAPLVYRVLEHLYSDILEVGFMGHHYRKLAFGIDKEFTFVPELLRHGIEDLAYSESILLAEKQCITDLIVILSGRIRLVFQCFDCSPEHEAEEMMGYKVTSYLWRIASKGSTIGVIGTFGNNERSLFTAQCASESCRFLRIPIADVKRIALKYNLSKKFQKETREEAREIRKIRRQVRKAHREDSTMEETVLSGTTTMDKATLEQLFRDKEKDQTSLLFQVLQEQEELMTELGIRAPVNLDEMQTLAVSKLNR